MLASKTMAPENRIMLTTTLFLESAIGGVIEAAAGKGFDIAGSLGKRDDGPEPAAVQVAIEQVVRRAIKTIRADHAETPDDELSRDVLNQLDHPPFAGEVARALIFQGGADLNHLRDAYLTSANDEDVSDRWRALEGPLVDLFDEIDARLLKDPVVGPALRDARKIRQLARVEEANLAMLDAMRVMTTFAQENVDAVRDSGGVLRAIEAILGDLVASFSDLSALGTALLKHQAASGITGRDIAQRSSLSNAEGAYLRMLRADCNQVPLAHDARESPNQHGAHSPQLNHVYVDLATTADPDLDLILDRVEVPDEDRDEARKGFGRWPTHVEGSEGQREALQHVVGRGKDHPLAPWVKDENDQRRAMAKMSALEALAYKRRMVLLGDPGSGKSTLVNHLAYLLASDRLPSQAQTHGVLPAGLHGGFPIRIEMRKWHKAWRQSAPSRESAGWELVYLALATVASTIDRQQWDRRLNRTDTIVLFDGLDEVPETHGKDEDTNPRKILTQAVREFCVAHDQCMVLVTSRIKPYAGYQLEKLPSFELAPLDTKRIARFCDRWYAELVRIGDKTQDEAKTLRERLADALDDRKVLADMAPSPLLLTMLAHINARTTLPQDEADLYQKCVAQLLWRWEKKKEDEGGVDSLQRLLDEPSPPVSRIDIEQVLWRLTFEGYAAGEEGNDLGIGQLEAYLAGLHPHQHDGKSWASRLIALMRERGGLLLDLDDVHLTFPHKSFREYMAGCWLADLPNVNKEAARLARGDDNWHEVIAIACGHLRLRGSQAAAQAILTELAYEDLRRGGEARWKRALLAGRIWRDFGRHKLRDSQAGKKLNQRMEMTLNKAMTKATRNAKQRCDAAFILADASVVPKDLDAFITIDATETLGYTFQVGKYPVTNHQFRAFVNDGGYDRSQDWWSDKAESAIMKYQKIFADGQWPTAPRFWHRRTRNRATQPVTGVSWFEATAYCDWLTTALHAKGVIAKGDIVRLPCEPEWAFAAAGSEGRTYPWNGKRDPTRLNHSGTGLGHPAPVHMHPRGATPDMVFDLCGNVWEWTATRDQGVCTLAGGAYYMNENDLSSSARLRGAPVDWLDHGRFSCGGCPHLSCLVLIADSCLLNSVYFSTVLLREKFSGRFMEWLALLAGRLSRYNFRSEPQRSRQLERQQRFSCGGCPRLSQYSQQWVMLHWHHGPEALHERRRGPVLVL